MYQYTIFDVLKKWAEAEILEMMILRNSVSKSFLSFSKPLLSASFGEVVSDFIHSGYNISSLVLNSLAKSIKDFSIVWGIDFSIILPRLEKILSKGDYYAS